MQKAQWGCREAVRQPFPYRDDDPVSLCPLHPFRDDPTLEARIMSLHLHWERGILPEPGALEDQPFWFSPCMVAVVNGLNHAEEVEHEKAKRKAEKESRQSAKRR